MLKPLVLGIMLATAACAQLKNDSPEGNGMTKPEAQLLEENEHYRVFRFELPGESQVNVSQRGSDVLIVALGEGLGLTSSKGSDPEKLADGDVRFVKYSAYQSILHAGAGASQALVIGLKHHWDVEIRSCAEPKTCNRPIRAGGVEIGQSTNLFTNGYLSASRHRMERGGTLATSYYSSKGKDHLLLVALADLQANFDGIQQNLQRGQVFGSDAGEVDVEAGAQAVTWVVIRVEVPK